MVLRWHTWHERSLLAAPSSMTKPCRVIPLCAALPSLTHPADLSWTPPGGHLKMGLAIVGTDSLSLTGAGLVTAAGLKASG